MNNISESSTAYKKGLLYTAGSYFLWGIIPLYWKLINDTSSEEILAHRIFWSFLFMLVLLTIYRQWLNAGSTLKRMLKQPLLIIMLLVSSFLISTNWFVYIWAVNHDNMLEASLGYYINPLISVLLGMVFLKEKLNFWQKISFFLAGIGILLMTLHYGQIPWSAIILALTFGLYGLTKKLTKLTALIGLTFETLAVTPLALYYLTYIERRQEQSFLFISTPEEILLIGAGVATAVPLLLFASGAQRIPLFMVGILQYISPTLTLLLGVFVYHEPFTKIEAITFSFIWSALVLFTISNTKLLKKVEFKQSTRKSMDI